MDYLPIFTNKSIVRKLNGHKKQLRYKGRNKSKRNLFFFAEFFSSSDNIINKK
jgi:hypothetical protein